MNKRIIKILSLLGSTFWDQKVDATEFLTDTPVPAAYEEVYVNLHAQTSHTKNGTTSRIPAVESLVGFYPDFQFITRTPVVLAKPKNKPSLYYYGDVVLGVKYRFIHETKTLPHVAFYPKFTFPSGDVDAITGNKTMTATVPFWFQKNWSSWKLSWGGGYLFNPAKNKYNFPFGGILLQKEISEYLTLGNELYAEGARDKSFSSRLLYNAGGTYYFTDSTYTLFSIGHSIAGAKSFIAFFGVGVEWGPHLKIKEKEKSPLTVP
ncbi:MAG: transporter [Alphaproteobacteria bacterium]|nr:transporter [Alphaproteobacteria bacterium]